MVKLMAKIEIPFIEPWWKQVGWLHEPNMDCYFSIDPGGAYERISTFALHDLVRCGVYKAPEWFESIYPDWREQLTF